MAIYVAIDESYSVERLNGIDAVVKCCAKYYTQDGQRITNKLARAELQNSYMNVYEYDPEALETAQEYGSVIGVDWTLKIQPI